MGTKIIRCSQQRRLSLAKFVGVGCVFICVGLQTACTQLSTLQATLNVATITPTNSTTVTSTTSGARAAKVFFNYLSTQSSFDSTGVTNSVSGTSQQQTSSTSFHPGLQPIKVFNPDGTLLGSRTYNADGSVNSSNQWPGWLSSVDIGISGPNNTSATSSACARFADTTEGNSSLQTCKIGSGTTFTSTHCGAPTGQFRISEADCQGSTAVGTGGPGDGVYLRAVFNRGQGGLASTENILVVIDYLVSSLNPGPQNPQTCFSNGTFFPEGCADFTWKAYLKHSISENSSGITIQPFFLFIPPIMNSILGAGQSSLAYQNSLAYSGVNPTARQIILPLATDPALSVLQISRIQSRFPSPANLTTYCGTSTGDGANSPLCAGVIFYSMTFYRI